jgi:hypothetical protein
MVRWFRIFTRKDEPPKTEEEKRAEKWARVVWPATRNAILETSRHRP